MERSKDTDELRRQLRGERHKRRARAAQRQGLFYLFCIASLGGLYWYAQGDLTPTSPWAAKAKVVLDEAQNTMLRDSAESVVQPLAAGDRRKLERQRGIVDVLARRRVGTPRRGGAIGDLRLLQSLVDDRVLSTDQSYELQALGVVLGDVMAEQLDLSWVVVDDQYGRTRALQYGSHEDVFFPVTMISRRYEKNIPVDVDELYRKVESDVARLRARF
jgi:hypothetical protein